MWNDLNWNLMFRVLCKPRGESRSSWRAASANTGLGETKFVDKENLWNETCILSILRDERPWRENGRPSLSSRRWIQVLHFTFNSPRMPWQESNYDARSKVIEDRWRTLNRSFFQAKLMAVPPLSAYFLTVSFSFFYSLAQLLSLETKAKKNRNRFRHSAQSHKTNRTVDDSRQNRFTSVSKRTCWHPSIRWQNRSNSSFHSEIKHDCRTWTSSRFIHLHRHRLTACRPWSRQFRYPVRFIFIRF